MRGHGWCAYRRSASLLGRQQFVARVEQRETRELRLSFIAVPGFRFAQSGLRNNSGAPRIARTISAVIPGARSASPESITTSLSEGAAENVLHRQRIWIPGSTLRVAPE
jgi:hypothetical protein